MFVEVLKETLWAKINADKTYKAKFSLKNNFLQVD
jgi:hypothetical protein